jgi:hypothetical protein
VGEGFVNADALGAGGHVVVVVLVVEVVDGVRVVGQEEVDAGAGEGSERSGAGVSSRDGEVWSERKMDIG